MDYMSCVSSIFNMCFPQNWTEILRSSSDGSHGTHTTIVSILKVIFRLSKVNDLDFSSVHQKLIGWFHISVGHSYRLKVAHGGYHTDNHLLELLLVPEQILLLSLPEEVF